MHKCTLSPLIALAVCSLGLTTAKAQTGSLGIALVRHAPTISGAAHVEGNLQQMLPENVQLSGNVTVTGELRVPGTPKIKLTGNPAYGGLQSGTGSASPANTYQVQISGSAALGKLVNRTDPVILPSMALPPLSQGTREVNLTAPGQSAGDWATVRKVQINGSAGTVAVPSGTYQELKAEGSTAISIGTAGSIQPAIYNIQTLVFQGQARLLVAGPVVVNVKEHIETSAILGNPQHPEWLMLNVYDDGLKVTGNGEVHGFVGVSRHPQGLVKVDGNALLRGSVVSNELEVTGSGNLVLVNGNGSGNTNNPPIANARQLQVTEDTAELVILSGSDPDGNSIIFNVVTQPAHGSLTGSAPNLVYTPAPNYSGPDGFSFKVNDGQVDSSSASVAITVIAVNDPPVAQSQSATIAEDAAVTFSLGAADVDSTALSFAIVTPPQHGVLTGILPSVTYTPAANYNGTDSFQFSASDGASTSMPATVFLTIAPVNDAPSATAQVLSTPEDTAAAVALSGNDLEGNALSYTVTSTPAHGVLSGTAPNVVYMPAANFNGSDSFTFTVSDGQSASEPAVVSISVGPVNDAPLVDNLAVSLDEDSTAGITASGFDYDADSLVFSVVTQPSHGTLTSTADGWIYAPTANFHGSDTFTYEASDGTANSEPGIVTITVVPVNDAPAVEGQAFTVVEDTSAVLELLASDLDGDDVVFNVSVQPEHGTLLFTNGGWSYTPAPDFFGSDAFTFNAVDGHGLASASAVATITVTPQNDVPVATAQSVGSTEDTALNLVLSGTDVENSTLTFTVLTLPEHGTLSGDAPALTYTPFENFHGMDSFSFKVNDGTDDSPAALVEIGVSGINDAPVAVSGTAALDEDGSVGILLQASDSDGDSLSFAVVAGPEHGQLTGTPPSLVYTPNANFNGSDTFSFIASDGQADSTGTITLSVAGVNDAPVASDAASTTAEDTSVLIQLVATDADEDALTFTVLTPPANGAVALNGGVASYTPNPNFNGADSFTFLAHDGNLPSIPATVSISVNSANDTPTADDLAVTTLEDTPVSFAITGSDIDGDPLQFQLITNALHGTIAGIAPHLAYTPAPNFSGGDSITFRVFDGTSYSAPATIMISVGPENDAPSADDVAVFLVEDGTAAVSPSGFDLDGDVITFSLLAMPSHGSIAQNGDGWIYTPSKDFSGTDSFTYRANDGQADSSVAVVSLTITQVNDAPSIRNVSPVSIAEDSLLSITVDVFDAEGDATTVAITRQPAHGHAELAGSALTYQPAPNFSGTDDLQLTAFDGTASSAPAELSITVLPINDRPEVDAGATLTVNEGEFSALAGIVSDDGDPVGNTLTLAWTMDSGPAEALIIGNDSAEAAVRFPIAGTYVLRLSASDGELTGFDTVTIVAKPLNKAPVVHAGADLTVAPGADVLLEGTAEDDALPPQSALAYAWTQITGPEQSQIAMPANASTHALFERPGLYVLRLAVSDGELAGSDEIAVHVIKENSAPLVDAGNDLSVQLPDSAQLAGSVTDDGLPDSSSLSIRWLQLSGPADTNMATAEASTTTIHFSQPGVYVFQLSASDGELSATDVVAITVRPPSNHAPVVNAGAEQSLSIPHAWLAGTASDDNLPAGSALSYSWTQVSGPGITAFSSPSGAATEVSFTQSGDYVLRLTVSDSELSSTSDVAIHVAVTNRAPTVNAGADIVLRDAFTTQLAGFIADDGLPASGVVTQQWQKQSGPGNITFADEHSAGTSAAFSEAGAYVLKLAASDGSLESDDTVAIQIISNNSAPTVNAGADKSVVFGISYSANLIANPSADLPLVNGEIPNWTEQHGPSWTTSAAVTPKEGTAFFWPGNWPSAELRQTVDLTSLAALIDLGSAIFEFRGFMQSKGTEERFDYGSIVLQYFNGAGQATSNEITLAPQAAGQWVLLSDRSPAPVGSRSLRIRLLATQTSDTSNDVYFDALSFRQVQMPSTTLDGLVSDDGLPTGSLTTRLWQQISGPLDAVLTTPNTDMTAAYFGTSGTYGFKLTGNDGRLTASDTMSVTVSNGTGNRPPVVNAGPDITAQFPITALPLTATVSDDLTAVPQIVLSWSKVSGPGIVAFSNPTAASTTVSLSREGSYVLKLTAFDGTHTSSDEITVTQTCTGILVPLDLVFVIDMSGSMSGGKAANAKAAGVALSNLLNPPTDRLGLVSFSDAAVLRETLTNDFGRVAASIQALPITGGTNIAEGLRLAKEDLLANGRLTTATPVIVLLSDGVSDKPTAIAQANQAKASGIRIVTIGLGADADEGLMRTIATSRGDYFYSPTNSEMSGIISEIVAQLDCRDELGAVNVYAGPDADAALNTTTSLSGRVDFTQLPEGTSTTIAWTKVSGPGTVAFSAPDSPLSMATFSTGGSYVLKLTATAAFANQFVTVSDLVTVRVNLPPVLDFSPGIVACIRGDGSPLDEITGALPTADGIYSDGMVRQALHFTSLTEQLPLTYERQPTWDLLAAGNEGFTVECWAKRDSIAADSTTSYWFGWSDGGTNSLLFKADSLSGSTVTMKVVPSGSSVFPGFPLPNVSNWNHIAFTFNRATHTLSGYLNGNLVLTSTAWSPTAPLTSGNFRVGVGQQVQNWANPGLNLDELCLYNRELSAGEIGAIFAAGANGKAAAASNHAPIVYAGADQDLPGTMPVSAALNGQAVDDGEPAGNTLAYSWGVVDGPGNVQFSNADQPNTSAVFGVPGTYVLSLQVSDGRAVGVGYVTIHAGTPPVSIRPSGLRAWWRLDNSPVDVVNGLEMGLFGPDYVTGKAGRGLQFEGIRGVAGSDDSALVTANPAYNITDKGAFSIEWWMNAGTSQTSFQTVLFEEPGIMRVLTNYTTGAAFETVVLSFNGQNVSGRVPLDGAWHHCTALYDPSIVFNTTTGARGVSRFYVDGALSNTTNIGIVNASGNGAWRLGYDSINNGANPLKASIDELSMYDRALTASEIASLFNSGSWGKTSQTTNAPPIAAANGAAHAFPGDNVSLTVSATDDGLPAGSSLTYSWAQTNGPVATITDATTTNAHATLPAVGIYTFRCTVSDGSLSDYADVQIEVTAMGNQAPVVSAGPDQSLPPGNTFTLTGSASDDGRPFTGALHAFWSSVSGPGTVTFGADALITPVYVSLPGTYILRLTATDGDLTSSDDVTVTLSSPPNQAPVVELGPDQSIAVGSMVALGTSLSDDGLPTSSHLTMRWLTLSAPVSPTFAANGNGMNVTFPSTGVYTIKLIASDGEYEVSDQVRIYAGVTNAAPAVNAGIDKLAFLGTPLPLSASVTDEGLPLGSTVTGQWSVASGPGSVTFASAVSMQTTATFTAEGDYDLTFGATDGALTGTDTVHVHVFDGPQSPTIAITQPINGTHVIAGKALDISATAADADGTVQSVVFLLDGAPVGTDTLSPFVVSLLGGATSGAHTLNAIATDNEGRQTISIAVTITAVADTATPPTMAITAPTEGGVITAPSTVTGTVDGPLLRSWQLAYRPAGIAAAAWTQLTSGTASVVNGTLGTIDPSLLENGAYELRLTADDLRNQTWTLISAFAVDGALKIGQFTLAFEDFKLDAPGIPISVTRTYDSRATNRAGDFGPGWRVGLRSITMSRSGGPLGEGWHHSLAGSVNIGGFPFLIYSMQPTKKKRVVLTFPDGRCEIFEASIFNDNSVGYTAGPVTLPALDPNSQYGFPIDLGHIVFKPVGPSRGSLRVAGNDRFVNLSGTLGDVTLYRENNLIASWDTGDFIFTDDDGTEYTINQTSGLQKVRDRNANELTIGTTEIAHSNGDHVLFTRDAQGRITSLTDPAGNSILYAYNTIGTLASVTDRVGAQTGFQYTNTAHPYYLTGITDPRGIQAIRSEYDAEGRLIRQLDADGNAIQLQANLTARTQTITDRLGHSTVHSFDTRGNIVRTVDALGNITTRTYDANDRELSVTDPLGHTTSRTYDAMNNVLSETDPLGHTTHYTFNTRKQPLSITDPLGHVTHMAYDPKGNVTSFTDAAGHGMTFSYNTNGTLASTADAIGTTTSYTYDSSGREQTETVKGPDGRILGYRSFAHNSRGYKIRETDFSFAANATDSSSAIPYRSIERTFDNEGHETTVAVRRSSGELLAVTSTAWNLIGKPVSKTDAIGRVTTMSYDARANLQRTTYPDGSYTETTYDAENRLSTQRDRIARVTQRLYDALGQNTSTILPCGCTEASTFDAAGHKISSTNEGGATTLYGYDASGRNTTVTDALGNVTTLAFDAAGREVSRMDALGQVSETVFDAANRPIKEIHADGSFSQSNYDAKGRPVLKIDEMGRETQYEYNGLDQLVAVVDALGNRTVYHFDSMGRQIREVDALGHTTSYQWNELDQRISRTLPGGQSEHYTFDAAGQMASHVDFNGFATTHTFNTGGYEIERIAALNHPSLVLSHAAAKISWTRDALGQAVTARVVNVAGTLLHEDVFARDDENHIAVHASSTGTLTYSYDEAGNVASVDSDQSDGVHLSYVHDSIDRLTSVDDHNHLDGAGQPSRVQYTFDAAGRLTHMMYPNGVRHSFSFDALNRPSSLAVSNAAQQTVFGETVTRDLAGSKTEVAQPGGRTASYIFDAAARLSTESIAQIGFGNSATGVVNYTLDAVGNRLVRSSTVVGVGNQSFSYNANNQLNHHNNDANGNTLISPQSDYEGLAYAGNVSDIYDFENRLIRRTRADGTVIDCAYNADGFRVGKAINGSWTRYLVDQNNHTGYAQVFEERDASGQPIVIYAYGLDLVSQDRNVGQNWQTHFYLYDTGGTVRGLTNVVGDVTDSYDFDAFGVLISQTGTTPNSYLYRGEQFDADLGLYQQRARYLNTALGRFQTLDTWEGRNSEPLSLNKYLYASAEPLEKVDPGGNEPLTLAEALVVARQTAEQRSQEANWAIKAYRTATNGLCRVAGKFGATYLKLRKTARKFRFIGIAFQAHHVLSNADMVSSFLNYNSAMAFAIPLLGGNGKTGSPHDIATQVQNTLRGTGTPHRIIAIASLVGAGCTEPDAASIVDAAIEWNNQNAGTSL